MCIKGEGSSQTSDTDLGQILSCVNLSKSHLSLPQFPQVQNGDNQSTSLSRAAVRVSTLTVLDTRCFQECQPLPLRQ